MICGYGGDAIEWPDIGNDEVPCCMGSALDGPTGCTCWEPVYDLAQTDPTPAPPGLRTTPCHDCAYRGGSPERQGADHVNGDTTELDRLVVRNQPFFCHQGLRHPTHYTHPTGATHTPPHLDAAYQPPIHNGTPYKHDGTPADLCAGWAQARLHHKDTP